MDDIGLFDSTLGADGGAAGSEAIDNLTPSDALGNFDVITPVVEPIAGLLDATGQAEMNGVASAGTAVSDAAGAIASVIPSKTTIFSAGILIAVVLVLVLLIVGKVEQL